MFKDTSKMKTLRAVLEEAPQLVPCVYDCLSARIIEDTGFKAMCLSGGSVAAAYVGVPDIGLVSFSEVKDVVTRITARANIPMIVDIDTGFGNELNIIRTCEEMAQAGAMAVHLEDQVSPKRCGHMQGKQVIAREEYFSKLRAAHYALEGTDCLLIARTDSYHTDGVEEAIRRNLGSLEAGADITFTEGTERMSDIERIAKEVPGWKMFDMLYGGASPRISFKQLVDYGYRLVTVPMVSLGGAVTGITEFAQHTFKDQSDFYIASRDTTGENISPFGVFEMMNIDKWLGTAKMFNDKINMTARIKPKD